MLTQPLTRLLVLLAVLPGPFAAPAGAATPDPAAVADHLAVTWSGWQLSDGLFADGFSSAAPPGFGPVMLGYALMRAGERTGRPALVLGGLRALSAETSRPPAGVGVFEELSFATAYRFADRTLAGLPAFERRRASFRAFLRSLGTSYHGALVLPCLANPACFHNQELIGALADLTLLDTGVTSRIRGTKLAHRGALRAHALRIIGTIVPRFTGRRATSFGPDPVSGLGLLSDTSTWPLAYHALDAMALAQAVDALGPAAPAAARRALVRATEALAALMAPDGDIAYLGRRQEHAWALAAAACAGETASRLAPSAAEAARFRTMAARAMARLAALHPIGAHGIRVVPRPELAPSTYAHGLDVQNVNYNGLTAFALDLAADSAPKASTATYVPLRADADGYFLDPDQARLAAVRHGDVWFAVHARLRPHDLRYGFGLLALKHRAADSSWHDVLEPPPYGANDPASAGPVVERRGKRFLPDAHTITVAHDGVVGVRGGFRAEDGTSLGRRITFRFVPVRGGVRLTFPARRGDTVRLIVFLGARARARPGGVTDATAIVTTAPAPSAVAWSTGYASCCTLHLRAAALTLHIRRTRQVAWTTIAR